MWYFVVNVFKYCLKLYLLYLIIIVSRATGKISLLLLTVLPSWNKVITYLLTVIQTENFFGILISTRLFPIPKHSLHDCNLLYVSPSFTFYASLIFCVCSCCQMTPLVYAFSSFLYPFTMLFVDLFFFRTCDDIGEITSYSFWS